MKRPCLLLISLLLVGCVQTKVGEPNPKQVLQNDWAVVEVDAQGVQGTGFITSKGYIMTADHVVPEDTDTVRVTYYNRRSTQATVVYTHPLDYAYLNPDYIPPKATQLDVIYCCYPDEYELYNSHGYPNSKKDSKIGGVVDVAEFSLEPRWIRYFKTIKGGMSGAPLIQKNTDDVYGILVMKNGSVAKAVPTKLMKNFPGGGANGGKSPSKN